MNKNHQKIIFFLLFIFQATVFAAEQKRLTIVFDWFINPNHAPLLMAEQEGFFAKHGLQVKFITPADVSEGEKMVAANRADVAVTYQPVLTYHVVRGLPVIRFATLIDNPLNCFVALDGGPISSLQDLKGKRIGSSASEVDNIIFSTMLESAGLSLKDLTMVNVGFNLTSTLLTKKIDGFTGGMRNFEPLAVEVAGKKPRVFYPEEYGFPKYDELIFVTNKNKINDHVLVDFTEALKECILYLKKNPKEGWEKFAFRHPELNNALNKKAWLKTLPYFASDPAKLDRKRYEGLMQFMWQKKQIARLPKLEEYAVEIGKKDEANNAGVNAKVELTILPGVVANFDPTSNPGAIGVFAGGHVNLTIANNSRVIAEITEVKLSGSETGLKIDKLYCADKAKSGVMYAGLPH